MEIWQFGLSIVIIFALLGVIIAILVKKHRDKHRIVMLQKNIDELENNFKTIKDQFEVIAAENIDIIEQKCNTMKEFLAIADKKYFLINDLLKSSDKNIEILKEHNNGLIFNSEYGKNQLDKEEIKSIVNECVDNKISLFNSNLDSIDRHLGYLNSRVENLENKLSNNTDNSITIKEINDIKLDIKKLKDSISEKITNEVTNQLNYLDKEFSDIANKAIDKDRVINNGEGLSLISDIVDLPKNLIEYPKQHSEKENNNLSNSEPREYFPKGKEFVVKEILELYEQGISIPQIASKLKMSRGEILLIIKMNDRIINKDKISSYGN